MISSLDLLAVRLLIQPKSLLAVPLARTQIWPMLSCPPGQFLQNFFPVYPFPSWAAAGGLPFVGLHLAFLLAEFLTVLFSTFL